jgi:hypothetical protein
VDGGPDARRHGGGAVIRNAWEWWLTLVDSTLSWVFRPTDDLDWCWVDDDELAR